MNQEKTMSLSQNRIVDAIQSQTHIQTAAPGRDELMLINVVKVASATVFMALCAHVSIPLVFSPVPITLQPFGVILMGLLLGSRLGFAALALYLFEGAAGLPVFSPAGPGGVLQLLGPTGGFLMASPMAAWLAGRIFESRKNFGGALLGCIAAELSLFIGGMGWFMTLTHATMASALTMTVLPFIPGELLKVAAATGIAMRWKNPGTR